MQGECISQLLAARKTDAHSITSSTPTQPPLHMKLGIALPGLLTRRLHTDFLPERCRARSQHTPSSVSSMPIATARCLTAGMHLNTAGSQQDTSTQ